MRQITVALCVDDENGMMFGGRRQSRDRVLIGELMQSHGKTTVCIGPYSKLLFSEYPEVQLCEDPLEECPNGGVCFIEDCSVLKHLQEIGTLIVYHWNRRYPADFYFEFDPIAQGFTLVSVQEFEGSSHEKITKEIYRK